MSEHEIKELSKQRAICGKKTSYIIYINKSVGKWQMSLFKWFDKWNYIIMDIVNYMTTLLDLESDFLKNIIVKLGKV